MARYGSEAYDLSMYEPKPAKITPLHGKKATKADKRRAKLQKLINTAAGIFVSCVVLAVVGLMISSQARLTELNSAINQKQTELSESIGETKRLESELAAQTSAQSVEAYAEAAGLRPMESGQIDYITVDEVQPESSVVSTTFWGSLWNTIKAWIQ